MSLPQAVADVVFCEVEDGAVLLHAGQEVYYGLNAVGAQIWQLLPPASASFDALVDTLAARYPEVARQTLETDVSALLTDLQANGLVTAGA